MQWGDGAIGKKFIRGVNMEGADNPVGEVIGVVGDFNYGSLHNQVEPLLLTCREDPQFMRTLSVRVTGGDFQNQILGLLLMQFSLWVVISNIIAWPLAYLVMKNWLQNFTLRIDFPFRTFLLSLLCSLTIAVITVGWQSLKASRMNPAASISVE